MDGLCRDEMIRKKRKHQGKPDFENYRQVLSAQYRVEQDTARHPHKYEKQKGKIIIHIHKKLMITPSNFYLLT